MRRPRLTRTADPRKKSGKWKFEESTYRNLDRCWRRKSCDILRAANTILANLLLLKAGVAFLIGVTNEFCVLFHYILKIFLEFTNRLPYKSKSYTR
jgi:hypothetical protein